MSAKFKLSGCATKYTNTAVTYYNVIHGDHIGVSPSVKHSQCVVCYNSANRLLQP